jgi:hypothetical protein
MNYFIYFVKYKSAQSLKMIRFSCHQISWVRIAAWKAFELIQGRLEKEKEEAKSKE